VLQETRGALDAAEMLVCRLQSAESDLSAAQVLVSSIGLSVLNRLSHARNAKLYNCFIVAIISNL